MPVNWDAVDELDAYVGEVLESRGLASCQYAIALEGEVVTSRTKGDAREGARYWLASSTKILPVTVVWQLIDEGFLDPSLPITHWWPAFGSRGKEQVTLEQVLGHSAGLTGAVVSQEAWSDRDRRRAEMEAWELEWEPGTRYEYHGLSAYWILAELIALGTDMEHVEAIRRRVLDPLGLDRLELGVPAERQGDVQPLVLSDREPATAEDLAVVLPDPALVAVIAPMLGNMALPPHEDPGLGPLVTPEGLAAGIPGGGAVSDAASLALLYQELLHNGAGLWSDDGLITCRSTVSNQHPTFLGVPAMRGLGTEISGDGLPEHRLRRIGSGFTSPAAFGHSGAGGQTAWADPVSGLSFVFLTNGWEPNLIALLQRQRRLDELAVRCVS